MRAAARSLVLLVVIACTPAAAVAQGGVNLLAFQAGSPTAKAGGVDVAVTQKPTGGYTCTKLVIRLIDDAAGLKVQVAVSATFTAAGSVDVKRISAVVMTPAAANPGGDGNG